MELWSQFMNITKRLTKRDIMYVFVLWMSKNFHMFKVHVGRMPEYCLVHILVDCQQYCSALFSLNQPTIRRFLKGVSISISQPKSRLNPSVQEHNPIFSVLYCWWISVQWNPILPTKDWQIPVPILQFQGPQSGVAMLTILLTIMNNVGSTAFQYPVFTMPPWTSDHFYMCVIWSTVVINADLNKHS
jgi:hypothetical protein